MEHTLSIYIDDPAEEKRKRRRRGRTALAILAGVIALAALPRSQGTNGQVAQFGVHVGTPISIVRSEPPAVTDTATTTVTETTATAPPVVDAPPQPLPAKAVITPARLVFSERDASAQFAVIRNDGGTAIPRVTASSDGPFVASNGCAGGVAAGAQCVVAVVFAPPKEGGKFAGTLKIAAGRDGASVALRGSAPPPPPPAPPPPPVAVLPPVRKLCFDPPGIRFETPGSQSITLTNPEKTPLRVVSIVPINAAGNSASGYSIDASPCMRMLAPGQQCAFSISANRHALMSHETMLVDVTYEDPATGIRRGAVSSRACGAN